MLCLRNLAHSAFGQVTVVMTRSTSGGRLLIALLVTETATDLHPEFSYAARLRPSHLTHTGVTGNDDFTYVAQVVSQSPADSGDAPLDSAFMSCIRQLLLQYHLLLSLCWFSAK